MWLPRIGGSRFPGRVQNFQQLCLFVRELKSLQMRAVASALKAAVKNGDLPKNTDCNNLAGFIVFAQHAAYLQSRVEKKLYRN
jgi:hypothetical protein